MVENLAEDLLGPAAVVAPRLLGCLLVREIDGQKLIGRIVETEAYDQSDAASHSYRGQSERNLVMFGPPGRLYVYFTYGMHYCANVVTGPAGEGAAVLIRAIEPLEGIKVMSGLRGGREGIELTNGPAKICQALSITKQLNGHDLNFSPLQLRLQSELRASQIRRSPRIGITKERSLLRRYSIKDNIYAAK